MHVTAPTLDDLLMGVYKKLLVSKKRVMPSRGKIIEETGALLEIKNPRARLSRTESRGKVFSCLGELLWYLAGTNDLEFISYYIPRYKDQVFLDKGFGRLKSHLKILNHRFDCFQ